jgi:hypothetical protein
MGAGRVSLAICVTTVLALAWIACIVAFAGPLHRATISKPLDVSPVFYWDHLRSRGETSDYGEMKGAAPVYQPPAENPEQPQQQAPLFPPNAAGQCDSGGAAFLSMMVLAFVCINLALFFLIFRFAGKPLGSPLLPPELLCALLAALFLVLACVVWGATCFAITRNNPNTSVKMLGFGYVIAATALLCAALPFMTWLMRKYQAKYGEPPIAMSFAAGAPGGPSTLFSSSMWNRFPSWAGGPQPSQQYQPREPSQGGLSYSERERERELQGPPQPSFQERAASWIPGWESDAHREERRARESRERWMWQQQMERQPSFPPRPYPGGSVQFSERSGHSQFPQEPPRMYQQQLPMHQAISQSGQQEQQQRERMQGRQMPIQQALSQHSPPERQQQQPPTESTSVPIDIRYRQ